MRVFRRATRPLINSPFQLCCAAENVSTLANQFSKSTTRTEDDIRIGPEKRTALEIIPEDAMCVREPI